MNKIQRTANKIFTPEFLTLMDSIPHKYVNDNIISEFIKHMDTQLHKKRKSDCLIAVTFYLTSIMADNEKALDISFNAIKKEDDDEKAEQYIQ